MQSIGLLENLEVAFLSQKVEEVVWGVVASVVWLMGWYWLNPAMEGAFPPPNSQRERIRYFQKRNKHIIVLVIWWVQ